MVTQSLPAAIRALLGPLVEAVRDFCVPAILSVRMHMHRSWKRMLFCMDWGGGGAAGKALNPRLTARLVARLADCLAWLPFCGLGKVHSSRRRSVVHGVRH